ncbi:polysaccharide deacetylase family protein [Luedemannella helvata]|uniref:polysaccharide deacetylase family protein n=1 Tax=Luedemannella helvata TaxID=349315 RepID=UPI0031D5EC1F
MSGAARAGRTIVKTVARKASSPVGSVRAIRTDAPHIVLTYDDGPDDVGTERVLAALARHQATATFFVLMGRVHRNPTLLREVRDAGHEIALHGLDHKRLTDFSAQDVFRRTRDGRAQLEDIVGAPVKWFRPPYGAQVPATWLAIRRAGLMPVVWGPTPGDWRDLPEEQLAQDAMAGSGKGSVVLCHDGHAGPADGVNDGPEPRIDRGKLADLMLQGFAARGLQGRSLADAMASGRELRWAWFKH